MFKKPIALLLSILIVVSIISISTVFAATYDFSYDANGNLIQGVDKYYEYDSFNNLVKIRDKNSAGIKLEEHIYDHNGNRIKKIEYSSSGTATTYYPDSNFIRVVDNSGTHDAIYYYDDSALVGKKDGSGTYFYHPNHLGSTNVVTDLAGNVVERTEYLPFGEVLNGGQSRFLFTGKEKDSTGLMYYGARYYDPFTRHFTQADTVLPDIYDPLQLNRYAYTRNNPVKYTDPSGNFLTSAIGAVLGFGANLIKQIISDDRSIFSGTIDYGETTAWTVGGAVAGTTFGIGPAVAGSGYGGAALGGGIAGFTAGRSTQLSNNLLHGNVPWNEDLLNLRDIGIETGAGAGLGVIGKGIASASGVLSKAVPKSWFGGKAGSALGRNPAPKTTKQIGLSKNLISKNPSVTQRTPLSSDIDIVPFKKGMAFGNGKLYGNKGTAIIEMQIDDYSKIQIHHHNLGKGAMDVLPSTRSINPFTRKLEPDSRILLGRG